MNANTLKKLIALQPKFREVMGNRSIGDGVYDTDEHGRGIIVGFNDKYPMRVNFYWFGGRYVSEYVPGEETLCLPSACDDRSEEARKRSLWGMVDWTEDAIPLITLCPCPDGKVDLSIDNGEGFQESYIHTDLTDALLSALIAQWGVEVEG